MSFCPTGRDSWRLPAVRTTLRGFTAERGPKVLFGGDLARPNGAFASVARNPMNSPDDRAGSTWLRYTHLGMQYCLTLLLCVGAGMWADPRLGTSPWLTIVGALLGFAAATYVIVREARLIR